MGYYTEVNTLLVISKEMVKPEKLKVGKTYIVEKKNERIFPLRIAILLAYKGFDFYGYVTIHKTELKEEKTIVTFKVLSLFNDQERKIYNQCFRNAAKKTGEIK